MKVDSTHAWQLNWGLVSRIAQAAWSSYLTFLLVKIGSSPSRSLLLAFSGSSDLLLTNSDFGLLDGTMPFKVAVVYYSHHGLLVTLANIIAAGARKVRNLCMLCMLASLQICPLISLILSGTWS